MIVHNRVYIDYIDINLCYVFSINWCMWCHRSWYLLTMCIILTLKYLQVFLEGKPCFPFLSLFTLLEILILCHFMAFVAKVEVLIACCIVNHARSLLSIAGINVSTIFPLQILMPRRVSRPSVKVLKSSTPRLSRRQRPPRRIFSRLRKVSFHSL